MLFSRGVNLPVRIILASLLISTQSAAVVPDEHSDDQQPYLTGEWGGLRKRLADQGIDPYGTYTMGVWSNLRGGFKTGVRYEGFAQWGVDAHLDKLLGWQGGRFHIGWNSYHGGQLSADLVGQFTTTFANMWEAAVSIRFYEIYIQQEWLDGQVLAKVGQLSADDDFFVVGESEALLNATFGFLSLGRDTPFAPFYPVADPGVYIFAEPAEHWIARGGVYSADPGMDVSSNFGFDWSFDHGAFFIGEVGTKRRPLGCAGTYSVGAVGTTRNGRSFQNDETVGGGYGLYGMINQALTVGRSGESKLGAFLRAQFGPEEDRSILRWYLDGGLKAASPLPGRDQDVVSAGVAFIKFGSDYVYATRAGGQDVSKSQLLFEFSYRAQVTGWLTLQPDLQLYFNPHFSRRDAVVLALQAVVDL